MVKVLILFLAGLCSACSLKWSVFVTQRHAERTFVVRAMSGFSKSNSAADTSLPMPQLSSHQTNVSLEAAVLFSSSANSIPPPTNTITEVTTADSLWYASLDAALDSARYGQVSSAMSISRPVSQRRDTTKPDQLVAAEASRADTRAVACGVRPVLATSGFRGHDPMSFGAYRRYQPRSGAQTGAPAAGSVGTAGRRVTANPGAGGKGKRKRDMSADRFYNALKKLGSGPSDKGAPSKTGVAEPPPGQKPPVQPSKAPTRRAGGRMVITPDDISSLFQPRRGEPDRYAEEQAELEELAISAEAESMNDRLAERRRPGSKRSGGDDREGTTGKEVIPQWLRDADRAGRQARRGAARKSGWNPAKDWRVWVGLITVVGFAAAFANVYHATGGFGSDHASALSSTLTREPLM